MRTRPGVRVVLYRVPRTSLDGDAGSEGHLLTSLVTELGGQWIERQG